jgi:membrane-bound serine protease (ClpP class)
LAAAAPSLFGVLRTLVCLLLFLAVGRAAVPSEARAGWSEAGGAGEAVHVVISGPLDVGTQSLLRRAIDRAMEGSKVLILELDTPGGDVELMFGLKMQISDAKAGGLLTVAWVHDRAYSAGALVALACERIYMRSEATIGAAAVVQLLPGGGVGGIEDPTLEAKATSAVRSAFRATAESNGRSGAVAEAMVDRSLGVRQVRTQDGELRIVTASEYDDLRSEQGGVQLVHTIAEPGTLVALSGGEAVRFGVADGLADSLSSVLQFVGHAGATLVPIERSRAEDFATWLTAVRYLLIGIGVMALIAEFKTPGFGLAGGVAIVCFGLALFGSYLTGLADVPHLLAVGLGLVLIAVELFLVPGTLWPGALGAVLVLGGLLFAQTGGGFFDSPLGREIATDRALKTVAGTLLALVAGALVSRFLPKTPLARRMLQGPTAAFAGGAPAAEFVRAPRLGEVGRAATPLRPVGKVRLDADPEEIEARSDGPAIESGTRVRVIAVEGLRAVVEPDRRSEP